MYFNLQAQKRKRKKKKKSNIVPVHTVKMYKGVKIF